MVRVFRYTVSTSSVYLQVESVTETKPINWNMVEVFIFFTQIVN